MAPFAEIGAPNVIAEAVKPAEDGSDAFVMRLYECEGTKTAAELRFGVPVKALTLTNILEDALGALPMADGKARLTFRPFEIKTIKCSRG